MIRVRLLATVPFEPLSSNMLWARTLPGGSPTGAETVDALDSLGARCGNEALLGTIARFAPMLVSLPLTMPA